MYALPRDLEGWRERRVSGLSCPDCEGVLEVSIEGRASTLQFACRIGHTFSLGELVGAKEERLESRLWTAYTALEELVQLIRDLRARGTAPDIDARYQTRLDNAADLARRLRALIEENHPTDVFVTTDSVPADADAAPPSAAGPAGEVQTSG
jgi:hypothetical protein